MDLDDAVWLWLEGVDLVASSIVVGVGHYFGPMLHVNGSPDSGDIALPIECSCDDRVCCGVDEHGVDWNGIGRTQMEM